MDKTDVLHVLPLIGPFAQSLFKERNRQVGPTRSAGVRLGQENGAEPVGDIESRIQRRRQIEKRIQEIVSVAGRCDIRLCCSARLLFARDRPLGAAVVLDRANPVHVGRQRLVGDAEATDGLAGGEIQGGIILNRRWRERRVADVLERDRNAKQRRDERQEADPFHLKSRREKMNVAAASRMAMYVRP